MAARKDNTAELFEAFQRFMAAQNVPVTETVPEPRKTKRTRSSGKQGTSAAKINATRKRTTTQPSRTTRKGVITCQQAWEALGADPTYAPSQPDAPARNAQLWKLNDLGLLSLKQ